MNYSGLFFSDRTGSGVQEVRFWMQRSKRFAQTHAIKHVPLV